MTDNTSNFGGSKLVAIFTGSRAEYSLFRPLIRKIEKSHLLKLSLVVGGSHLDLNHGYSIKEIEKDGFNIAEKIEMFTGGGSHVAISNSVALCLVNMSSYLTRIKPRLMLLLGDRFETFACGIACILAGVPIAHIHGGEITEGVIDDTFRHSLTKMASIHFVATEDYARRVIQLGEQPDSVYLVGALGVDSFQELRRLSRAEVANILHLNIGDKFIVVTIHPESNDFQGVKSLVDVTIAALKEFKDYVVIFTGANTDQYGSMINLQFKELADTDSSRFKFFSNLGGELYMSLLKEAEVVVGNSSSGIYEAPLLKVPTVNIGMRQHGRIHPKSVLSVEAKIDQIKMAVNHSFDLSWRATSLAAPYPFGDGNASERIVQKLESLPDEVVTLKKFYDLPEIKNHRMIQE